MNREELVLLRQGERIILREIPSHLGPDVLWELVAVDFYSHHSVILDTSPAEIAAIVNCRHVMVKAHQDGIRFLINVEDILPLTEGVSVGKRTGIL
jgi:fructose-1-phosphate kinase PfkB-like protein